MYTRIRVVCTVLVLFLSACKKDDALVPVSDPVNDPLVVETALSKITGINQDKSFVDAKGNAFFPWGFNYTNPQIINLIEDNWDQESTWAILTEDFAEMKRYTANVVRLHLQFNKYMNDANTPNEIALQRLQRLVKIAEDTRLYLDITGLASYRKSDTPQWYHDLSDAERWAAQAVFWKSVAAAIGDSDAVFAYNLMNEPVVSVGCDGLSDCDWLPGPGFGGYFFVQNITRSTELNFSTTMKAWVATLTKAIRSEDSNTLITTGFLAIGSVTQFEDDLDYVSIHVYPKSGEIHLAVEKVLRNQGKSALILEETSNLNCNIDELESFLNQIEGKYNGLMGHYFGKTLTEMQANDAFTDGTRSNFINFFMAKNPN